MTTFLLKTPSALDLNYEVLKMKFYNIDVNQPGKMSITRRSALVKLGLAAVVVYSAPLLSTISEAQAGSGASGGSSGGSSKAGAYRNAGFIGIEAAQGDL